MEKGTDSLRRGGIFVILAVLIAEGIHNRVLVDCTLECKGGNNCE